MGTYFRDGRLFRGGRLFDTFVYRVGAYIQGGRLFESSRYVFIFMVITGDIEEII